MFSELQVLHFFLAYISFMSFVGYILSCIAYKHYKLLMPIGMMLLITFISEPIAQFVGNSFTVFHFYNPLQFILFCWFFYINFENRRLKMIMPYIAIAAIIFGIINSVFLQSINVNPSNFIISETLLLIILSIFLFIEKLDSPAQINIFKDPVFIATAAILLFNIFSFLSFLTLDYFIKHNLNSFTSIYRLLYFANFIFYGLLVTANLFSLKNKEVIKTLE